MGETTNSSRRVPATLLDTSPEVAHQAATEEADARLVLQGTAYHDGLNENAWGLTEQGAHAIAESLVDKDFTASHPPLRGDRYDRALHGGQGAPIGTVRTTDVVTAEEAMVDGGEYVVEYSADILDPDFVAKYEAGLFDADDYGVSVGIYADPESATCSVCGDPMASDACEHDRFEEVDGDVAGPLYDDGDADHLAAVYLPAYDNADSEVAALAGALAEPFAASTAPEQAADATAGDVSYSGTTTSEWSKPSQSEFDTDDLAEMGDHFFVSMSGFRDPDAYGDLKLPVVQPNGKLNKNALSSAKSYLSETDGLSDDQRSRIRGWINDYLADEFDVDTDESESSAAYPVRCSAATTAMPVRAMRRVATRTDSPRSPAGRCTTRLTDTHYVRTRRHR